MSAASSKKLSLTSAIFINLNVMIGTGIFINTFDLSTKVGILGCLLYPIVGIFMLPLIAVFGQLLAYFPTGGLYAFGKSSSRFLGFLSCWSYFFGKLASCSVMLFVGASTLEQLIPYLHGYNPINISIIILMFFTCLNLLDMKTGIMVQSFFLTSKSIPIVFALVAGIILFDTSGITFNASILQSITTNIPLVLYCLAGFETACALSRNIENPSVNGPKAVYYSFGIIMLLYGIFQGLVYISIHSSLAQINSYQDIFPAIAYKLIDSPVIAQKMAFLLNFAIGSSALGGAYGILFSNSWNLYTLAENNHLIGSSKFKQLNIHNTPWVAVLFQAIVCMTFLLCNQASVLPLRRTAALGIVIAYTISAFAYYQLLQRTKNSHNSKVIAIAAFITCMLFVANCISSFMEEGIRPLFLFIAIISCGIIMFYYQEKIKRG